MSISIVKEALQFYDENNEKYKPIKKKIKYFKFADQIQHDIEGQRIAFLDKDKKEIFTSRIEILGKYYGSIYTWIWGWSLAGFGKSLTSIIRKVFLYGTDIDVANPANVILKNELVTSRFRIIDDIQIEIHCAIASYLAKKPFILMLKEFTLLPDEIAIFKGEYDNYVTDSSYYWFVIDVPPPPVIE